MTCIEIRHTYGYDYSQSSLPCSIMDYFPILAQAAGTLQVLKLIWLGSAHYVGNGIDLRMYTALRTLAVPSYLLHNQESKDDPAQLIADRLPPNVRNLIFENEISFIKIFPVKIPIIPPKTVQLIRSLIEQKEKQTPNLNCILLTRCFDTNIDFPESLYSVAEKHKVQIRMFDRSMDIEYLPRLFSFRAAY